MITQEQIQHIPHDAGVYLFKGRKDEILYIGKAKNLHKRVYQYFSPGSVWKQDMVMKANHVEFITVQNESEALLLESNLIKKHQPPYNRLLKGDNSYVYVKITAEPFPQIFFTRTRVNDGAHYIGPKHLRNDLKKLLQYLRQIFKYRGCKTTQFNQGKLCSDYLFGICKGRCIYPKLKQKNADSYLGQATTFGFPADTSYQSGVQQSRHMINTLLRFFDGENDVILKYIEKEIADCIIQQNFEYAATLRDVYHSIDALTQKQSVIFDPSVHGCYMLIRKIGGYRVYCVIVLQQGKIIDVLRFKDLVEEVSLEQIMLSAELDYGEYVWSEGDDLRMGRTGGQISDDIQQHLYQQAYTSLDNFIVSDSWQSNSVMNDILAVLQQRYDLHAYPYRIECVDISHFSGSWTSGGLSCMMGGMLYKQGYRRYKIPKELGGNDFGSLRHVLIQRFKLYEPQVLSKDQLPDVFILDGGEVQMSVLMQLYDEYEHMRYYLDVVQFCGLQKGAARASSAKTFGEVEHLLVRKSDGIMVHYPLQYDTSDQLLVKLRDEAHRFANAYRTKQMGQELK